MERWLIKAENEMRLRAYSPKTVKTYMRCLGEYLSTATDDVQKFDEEHLRIFILNKNNQGKASQTINLYLNAVLFFYRAVLGQQVRPNIKFVKRPSRIPSVLSREEIQNMLNCTKNLKHRTMIALAYGAGLRVSEVVNLKTKDVDFDRSLIYVKQGKGRKDRVTLLPEKLKIILHAFCENRISDNYVFESARGGKLTTRTAQKIFEKLLVLAGVTKKATFHSLRHSFATHLIENSVDIRYVQELLGHQNIRTTQIYTRVTNCAVRKIQSPL
jgi:site-specific recombinase XerD